MRFWKFLTLLLITSLSLILAACQSTPPGPEVTPALNQTPVVPTQAPATEPARQPTVTATEAQPSALVVCTQHEPGTLYLYGGSSRSMWTVLEAIYDGPFDQRGFAVQPVILEKIPALADGDASLRPVTVSSGDAVVDVDGNLVALEAGTRVLPTGCTRPDCAVAWDGTTPLSMDQLAATFKLRPGLLWSDGEPLTSADSLFSYALDADPATPSAKYLTDRTFAYRAVDELTVEWTGLPGFYEQRFGTFFWLPLPKHAWGEKSAAELLNDPAATRSPLGWGPYVIEEWTAGDHITLRKNENYFRASEGLPKFDTLVVRFIGDTADGNLNALLAGECDVIDQNERLLEMIPGLLERESDQKLKTLVGQGPEWEHLNFGIRPASYDDGYNPAAGDRPDLFGDVRVRQAMAYCIDRQSIVDNLLFRRSVVPASFLPPSHPALAANVPEYPFDPDQGIRLLEEVGWTDPDGDTATPRVASGVAGVPDGTALSFEYITTRATLRMNVAQAVSNSLETNCGVHAELRFENPAGVFGPGPDGSVFGRKFDLVQFSWEASARPNCLLYTATQIPGAANRWIGANVSGFSSPEFDAACASAYWSRLADEDYADRQYRMQERFAQELPALPLYFYPKIALSRPDLCGLEMDVTARSLLWNLEGLELCSGSE